MKIISNNIQDTEKIVGDFLFTLRKLEGKNQALLICLFGDLGAGKTAFVKAVAKNLGIQEHVTSPTFVILKNYELGKRAFRRLVHIDAYRLESGKDLLTLGWDEIVSKKENIIFLEWPERVSEILPTYSVKIYFKHLGETKREIEIKWKNN